MAVTIHDVAREAGVSIRTVSRVVNNLGYTGKETRERVRETIDRLGYRPNAVARGLRSGRSASLGLIIPEITNPFFPAVVKGVESAARQHGYSVILCNTDDDPQRELESFAFLAEKQVDGLILCGSRLSPEQLGEITEARRLPLSVLTSRPPRAGAVVSIDGETGLRQLTAHLIGLGHTRIGYLGWQGQAHSERARGYRQALVEERLSDAGFTALAAEPTTEAARAAGEALLRRAPELTAVACESDLLAVGMLQAAERMGRRVPGDLSVTGFDDLPLASLVSPPLTTMRVPCPLVGQWLFELLLPALCGGDLPVEQRTIIPELVVRASTGPRPSER